jgi:hypothetical protein
LHYSPWATLRDLPHITLAVVRLPAGRAWWLPDVEGIALDDRLSQAERRSALEHELQHIEAEDTCCRVGPDGGRLSRRQERRTDDRAARRLIDLDALADALVWALDPGEVAEALHVDPTTVRSRVRGLTDDEKQFIERRIAARGDAA